jgi:hypothetical protein
VTIFCEINRLALTGNGRQFKSLNVRLTDIWSKSTFFDYQVNPYEEEEP